MDSTNDSGIKWGAEIAGDRPEWLDAEDKVWVKWADGGWSALPGALFRHANGSRWVSFRLPADHPHYQKQAAQAATPAIDPALVERMRQMIAKMATRHKVWDNDIDISRWCSEARDILKALEPVDEDLLEAREICAQTDASKDYQYLDGSRDDYPTMLAALAAIRRGRQLERGEK